MMAGIAGAVAASYLSGSATLSSSSDTSEKLAAQKEILALREKVLQLQSEGQDHEANARTLEAAVEELLTAQQTASVASRVHASAARAMKQDRSLFEALLPTGSRPMWVMSVDIRRSTELMLKARGAREFATFITSLCSKLMSVVHEHCGVVDKFTGDGILAFFPDSFSGADAGYLAVNAAQACHEIFADHYRNSRSSFQSVLTRIGLGIGIDYGDCHIVSFNDGITIVGVPVVYACRLGGAPAGMTLVNQSAYNILAQDPAVALAEHPFEPKNESEILAYRALLTHNAERDPSYPSWFEKKLPAGVTWSGG
jgi:class 3 adenylate cyclase